MSIVSKLLVLGLTATISSPAPRYQIDFTVPNSAGESINQLWLVTYRNAEGLEVVAQAKLVSGDYAPLIAADPERLESMMPAARELAKARNVKMRLIKLTNREDVEDISP